MAGGKQSDTLYCAHRAETSPRLPPAWPAQLGSDPGQARRDGGASPLPPPAPTPGPEGTASRSGPEEGRDDAGRRGGLREEGTGRGGQAASPRQRLCENDARSPRRTGSTQDRAGLENGPTERLVRQGAQRPGLRRGREQNRGPGARTQRCPGPEGLPALIIKPKTGTTQSGSQWGGAGRGWRGGGTILRPSVEKVQEQLAQVYGTGTGENPRPGTCVCEAFGKEEQIPPSRSEGQAS